MRRHYEKIALLDIVEGDDSSGHTLLETRHDSVEHFNSTLTGLWPTVNGESGWIARTINVAGRRDPYGNLVAVEERAKWIDVRHVVSNLLP